MGRHLFVYFWQSQENAAIYLECQAHLLTPCWNIWMFFRRGGKRKREERKQLHNQSSIHNLIHGWLCFFTPLIWLFFFYILFKHIWSCKLNWAKEYKLGPSVASSTSVNIMQCKGFPLFKKGTFWLFIVSLCVAYLPSDTPPGRL